MYSEEVHGGGLCDSTRVDLSAMHDKGYETGVHGDGAYKNC